MSITTIEMAFCVDDAYIPHLIILIESIKRNSSPDVNINFNIIGYISDNMKLLFLADDKFKFIFYAPISYFSSDNISERYSDRISVATYYRIDLPLILNGIDRVIYLDADMIVLEDIYKLWQCDLNGAVAGVVEDYNLQIDARFDYLGMKCKKYFNAGMMLIDLNLWMENKVSDIALSLIKSGRYYEYNDQDILNISLDGLCVYLNPRFNSQNAPLKKNLILQPVVVHFDGQEKPWHYSCEHPNKNDYFNYKSKTVFSSYPLYHYLDETDKLIIKDLINYLPQGGDVAIYGCGQRGKRIFFYIKAMLSCYNVMFMIDRTGGEMDECRVYQSYPSIAVEAIIIASIPYRNEILMSIPIELRNSVYII
jgi:Lipopolysaccharide biosynthesis proteins, LPS:glycosyltransferases